MQTVSQFLADAPSKEGNIAGPFNARPFGTLETAGGTLQIAALCFRQSYVSSHYGDTREEAFASALAEVDRLNARRRHTPSLLAA